MISSTVSLRRSQANELWLTEITEQPMREGKVYCAVMLDACSQRVRTAADCDDNAIMDALWSRM
jgi:hypothetical protein